MYTRDMFLQRFYGAQKTISRSFMARHLYTRQLACEPQTGSLAYFSVAVRNGNEKRPVLSTCRLLPLLYLYARTNNAKSLWQLKQWSIWKREIKSITCHYKQAVREKYLGYNSLECAGNILHCIKFFCKSSLTDYCPHD